MESAAKLMAARQWPTALWSFGTQNTAWYHRHHDAMNETGGKCVQNVGSQEQNAFHPPTLCSRTKRSGGDPSC